MTKQHASERKAFPDETNPAPRFVGDIVMFDPSRSFGKIHHTLPNGDTIKLFFHADEFKRAMGDNNRFYFGQKVEYSVRVKKPSANETTKPVSRNALDNFKAVDCIIYVDEPKLSNSDIMELLSEVANHG